MCEIISLRVSTHCVHPFVFRTNYTRKLNSSNYAWKLTDSQSVKETTPPNFRIDVKPLRAHFTKNPAEIRTTWFYYSGRKAPNLKMQMDFFFVVVVLCQLSDWPSAPDYYNVVCSWWSRVGKVQWADERRKKCRRLKCALLPWLGSMDCLFERSYHLQMHTPTAVDPH